MRAQNQKASLDPQVEGHLLLATSEADDAGGLNAVVTVGSEALLLLWRGYANPAVRACPAPRFEVARGLWAETLSALLLARSGFAEVTAFIRAQPADRRVGRASGSAPRRRTAREAPPSRLSQR
jgi:hypothetical protein